MSVDQFNIPRNTIEDIDTETSQEKLEYSLSEEQKRFMVRQVLFLLT